MGVAVALLLLDAMSGQVTAVTMNCSRFLGQATRRLWSFEQRGLLVLRSALTPATVDAARRQLDEVIWARDRLRRPDFELELTRPGTYRRNLSLRLRRAPLSVRRQTYRLTYAHRLPEPNALGRIIMEPCLLSLVQLLIGGPPHTIFSLLFERGTQQGIHDDTWYRLGSDQRGGMVGVWVALDRVDSKNGPLVYIPGSHRRPERELNSAAVGRQDRIALPRGALAPQEAQDAAQREALRQTGAAGLEQRPFFARAGDLAIWKERLLHGGAPIRDSRRSRRSLVLHYLLRPRPLPLGLLDQ